MSNKFDIKLVHDCCLNSLHEDDDVRMQEYLDSYEELDKFCSLMGVVFGFVSKDLRAKMEILYEFLKNQETAANFETVKQMIQYEKENLSCWQRKVTLQEVGHCFDCTGD